MILTNLIFPFDYIILLIIVLIIIFSFLKGFTQSLLGLLTWIGSVLITIYSYNVFANFLTKQLININFLKNIEYFTNIISIIISIPIIFLISLLILKKIRKFLISDLDKNILGLIFDKIFGLLYGIIFSYAVVSAFIILLERYEFKGLNIWLKNNSNIIISVNNLNNQYRYLFNTI